MSSFARSALLWLAAAAVKARDKLAALRSVSTSLRQVASEFSVENLLSRLM